MSVITFYLIIELFNILTLFSIIVRKEYQNGIYFIFVLTLTVRGYGQFVIASAKTLEMALYGNEMVYFGAAFLPACIFLAAAAFCGIAVPRPIKILLPSYSALIVFLSFTVGRLPIYYRNVTLVRHPEGFATLEKEYGPLHMLYSAMLVAYAVLFVFLVIYVVRHKKNVSQGTVIHLSAIVLFVILMYVLNRILKTDVNLTSISYLVVSIISLKLINDSEIRNLQSCIADSSEEKTNVAYVVIDRNFKFIKANDMAKNIFPEIIDFRIDRKIPDNGTLFTDEIMGIVREFADNAGSLGDGHVFNVGKKKYQLRCRDLVFAQNVSSGFFLEITDVTKREKYAEMQAKYRIELQQDVRRKERDIVTMQDQFVLGLASLVERRDNGTGEHIIRTNRAMETFVEGLKEEAPFLSGSFLDNVQKATPMHDLGRISISDTILKKEGRLTPEETKIIQGHAAEGAKVVRSILAGAYDDDFIEIAVNMANYHHEKWDGTGYPEGLKNRRIPVEGRIMAIVDAFDEMFEASQMGASITMDEAFDRIKGGSGTVYDPVLAEVFLDCKDKLRKVYANYVHSK